MTRATKIIITSMVVTTLLFALLLLSIQPVPAPTQANTALVEGIVKSVTANQQTKDVVFEIEGDGDTYYINRGMQMELGLEDLEWLVDKEASILYIRTTNPLEAIAHTHHISRITIADEIIFDEIESISTVDLAVN